LWPGGAIGEAEMATVLIVEDEAIIRDMITEELEDAGFTVVIATNADHAISILKPARYSLGLYGH
jgi:CheY-like chemotaxis protein